MDSAIKNAGLKELQKIPGVGKTISRDLWDLGIHNIRDLRGKNPEKLYLAHCLQKGMTVDRCVLYVFRCAVYYSSQDTHEPELLKWWNWKDEK
ncbi:MAG: helix-hairpin-helix domain-containing protein [Calditrichia bacterium]